MKRMVYAGTSTFMQGMTPKQGCLHAYRSASTSHEGMPFRSHLDACVTKDIVNVSIIPASVGCHQLLPCTTLHPNPASQLGQFPNYAATTQTSELRNLPLRDIGL